MPEPALSDHSLATLTTSAPPPRARSYAEITELRARHPEAIAEALAARTRRPFLGDDGQLMIVAADHPARGALSVRGRADAMASRTELLDRLQAALARPGVDGLLATADIAEDLLLLGALEGKVVIASMNRGGVAGAAYELDDRMTGYDVRGIVDAGFDAGKMLLRFDLDDPGTAATHEACARAVTELARAKLVAMVEPFMSSRTRGAAGGAAADQRSKVVNDLSPEAVIKSIHISQGIGATSAYTWMKLPVVSGDGAMERVMEATTLPTLILGGDPVAAPQETYATWRKALALPAVRGLVVGRALLFPPGDDVAAAVDTAVSLVR